MKKKARELKIPYYETSAKNNSNVELVFNEIIKLAYGRKYKEGREREHREDNIILNNQTPTKKLHVFCMIVRVIGRGIVVNFIIDFML